MKKTKFFGQCERKWVVVDASNKVLGRLSSRIATILQGKNKASYTPNALCGDKVVVINARKIRVSGDKMNTKIYQKYSGYPGGLKEMPLKTLMEKNPRRPLYLAVRGMLPKNWLGKRMLRSLRIYLDGQHQHTAQKPQKQEV